MEKVEAEAEGLVDEGLFAAAEESGAAGFGSTDAARRRNATTVKEGFGGGAEIEEGLLAEDLRPDWLVAFEAIFVERVVPMRLRVLIFAFLRIAAIVGLREGPAIRDGVKDVGDGRKIFGSEFSDVVGIGVETVAKFVVSAGIGRRFGRSRGRAEFRETRKAGMDFGVRQGGERNFECSDFVPVYGQVRESEGRQASGLDTEFVVTWGQRQKTEDAFRRAGDGDDLAGLQITHSHASAGGGPGFRRGDSLADDTVHGAGRERLLARYA